MTLYLAKRKKIKQYLTKLENSVIFYCKELDTLPKKFLPPTQFWDRLFLSQFCKTLIFNSLGNSRGNFKANRTFQEKK